MTSTRRTLLAGSFVLISGCLVEIDPIDPPDSDIPPDVQAAFDGTCALTDCHDSASASGGLSLEPGDSDAILDSNSSTGIPYVDLGNPEGSYMYLKLIGDPQIEGDQMPLGGGGDKVDIAVILTWIRDEVEFPEGGIGEAGFERDVWPIIEDKCVCHNSDAGAGGLVMQEDTAYDNLVNVMDPQTMLNYVDVPTPGEEGDPGMSYLWFKVTDTQSLVPDGGGGPMPPGSTRLDGATLQTIRDWIEGGALP